MKLNTITVPSMLPTAACALPVSLPINAVSSAWLASERVRVELVRALPMAVALVPVPQDHQVQTQAELGRATLVRVNGYKGSTGFKGSNSAISAKRFMDGASGVPPRGRPV